MQHDSDCCKAGRVSSNYGFTEKLTGKLGGRWENNSGPGLRQLAQQFNIWVISSAHLDIGEPLLDGEAKLLHKLLTADDVEDAERTRTRRRIEERGINPDELTNDFISYKTINRHFKNCTDRERNVSSEPVTPDDALDRVNRLKRRLEQVTAKSISEVVNSTALDFAGSDVDVIIQVNTVCQACGDRLTLRELFTDGCSCVDLTHETDILTSTEQV